MWGRLSSLAQNPNLASLSKLTKDGIGQLSRITTDVLAEVKAVESKATGESREDGDGWFGESDDDLPGHDDHDRDNHTAHSNSNGTKDAAATYHEEEKREHENEVEVHEENGAAGAVEIDESRAELEPLPHERRADESFSHVDLRSESLETLNADTTHEELRRDDGDDEEEELVERKEASARITPTQSPTTSPSLSFVPSASSRVAKPSTTPKSSSTSRSTRRSPVPSTSSPPLSSPSSPSSSSSAQLQRLQQQVATLTAALSAESGGRQQESAARQQIAAQLGGVSAQLEEARNSSAEAREELDSLQQSFAARDHEVTELTARLRTAQQKWDEEKQTSALLHFEELRQQRETKGSGADEAVQGQEAAEHSDAVYAEMVTQYLAEQARLEVELEEMRQKYEQATQQSAAGRDGGDAEREQRLQDEVNALQSQLEERDATVNELQTQAEEQRQQMDDYRQQVEQISDLEAELQRTADEANEAKNNSVRLSEEAAHLRFQLHERGSKLQLLTTELEQQQQQAESERATLLLRLQASRSPLSPSPSSPSSSSSSTVFPTAPSAEQSAVITQLHSTVEKLRRIIHKLTTERNDVLTVVQSVQNGLITFAEVNAIDVSDDLDDADGPPKDAEEERRRNVQSLVDKLLAGVQARLEQSHSAAASHDTASPVSAALTAQLSALQCALNVERETSAARLADVERLRKVKEEMVGWKDKASTAMAKLREDKAAKEKALTAAMQERELDWERRLYEEQSRREEELGVLKGTIAQLQGQLRTSADASASGADHAEEAAALVAQREEEIQQLRASRAEISAQLHALRSAEAEHLDKITHLESVIASTTNDTEQRKAQLSSTVTQLTQEKQELSSTVKQLESSLQALRGELHAAREEAAALIAALDAECAAQRERVVELERVQLEEREQTERGWQERDEHWKAREDDYATERDSYVAQVEELQRRLSEVQAEMKADMEARKEVLEGKVKETGKQMEEERRREKRERILLEGRIRELLEERERERREQDDEMQQLRDGGADRQRYEQQLSEKDRTIQQLRDERSQDHVAHLHAMKALRDEYDGLRAQHADLLQRWEERMGIEKELHAAVAHRQEQLRALQSNAAAWQQRDEERDAEIAQLHVRCAEAEKASERARQHLKEATAIIRQQYDEALQDIERQTIEIEGLRAQEEKGRAAAELCDQLSAELEAKEGECRANVEALNNLQLVLESVQAEHDDARGTLEAELSTLREQVDRLRLTEQQLREAHVTISFLQSSVASLRSDLLSAQSAVAAAQQENASLRASFSATVDRLKAFASDDHLIDRRLVVKLLVTFFERGQKEDTLHLMYRMLGLSDEDKERIERGRRGKGIGGHLYGLTSYVSMLSPFDASSAPMKVDTEDASLADLWVDFLLKEAREAEASKGGGTASVDAATAIANTNETVVGATTAAPESAPSATSSSFPTAAATPPATTS